jgi:hypothetical protein
MAQENDLKKPFSLLLWLYPLRLAAPLVEVCAKELKQIKIKNSKNKFDGYHDCL